MGRLNVMFGDTIGAPLRRFIKNVRSSLYRKLPVEYRQRSDSTVEWRERFGEADFDRVGRFLRIYCGAFLFPESDAARLRPDDKPIEIYRMLHAHWPVDQMEFETFHLRLRREFSVDFTVDDFEH